MSRDLIFSPEAEEQLVELQRYIAEESSPTRAADFVGRILDGCSVLAVFPSIGTDRADLRPGLRVFGVARHVTVAYIYADERVDVLGVFYGGRDWEPLLRH